MEKYGEYMFSLTINATLKNLNEAGSFGELSLEDIEEENYTSLAAQLEKKSRPRVLARSKDIAAPSQSMVMFS